MQENVGRVIILGAGCGKKLITLWGIEALASAEVLLYDDLIDTDLLQMVPEDCEQIYVGKRFGAHAMKQEAISELLVEKARTGKCVVRLKGGDPYVFGRGGEEVLALREAKIPYEVIPGVSSSIAVPGHLGIPVTHRGIARSFSVITGHTKTEEEEDFSIYGAIPGTLIFLMGLHHLEKICQGLQRGGKTKDTPVAIVSQGFSGKDARITGTLDTIVDKAKDAATPAIIVVGDVAAMDLRMEEKLPLQGIRVTTTGSQNFTNKLSALLEKEGAFVEKRPYLKLKKDLEQVPVSFLEGDILTFTSANGVKVFFQGIMKKGIDYRKFAKVHFACIGPGTAEALSSYGFYADLIPEVHDADHLAKALSYRVKEDADWEKVILLRAEEGSKVLNQILEAEAIPYEDYPIYSMEINPSFLGEERLDSDYILFGSAGAVRGFFQAGKEIGDAKVICIGPIAYSEAKKYVEDGRLLMASEATAESMVQKLLEEKLSANGH